MSDTASLKISVNTSEIKTANTELDKLSKTSGNTEKATQGVTKSFSALNAVLTVGAVSAVAIQYIKLADTMTGMTSKLKLVTNSSAELATAQEELFKIAQKTRQGYAETVDTYSNFAVAMGEMGKSQKEILRVTETVNKAIAISGGTAQQAAAATMQLGQAFASGTLRGDELNSILENSKGLAKAIADGMGVPIGKLRSLGAEGKITADILANALEKSAASVDEKFGKVGVTVAMSVTQIQNSLLQLVGEADKAMNGSGGLSEAFSYFAKGMDNNRTEIIESGKDAYRALQVMGVGMIQFGTSFYQAGVAIPTAIALAIDTATQLTENGINDMIGLAEAGANKVKSLYGGERVKLGRVDIDTNISKGLLSHYNAIVDTQENAIATQGKLFNEIMDNTTQIKKIAPSSDKGSGKKGSASEETKEQKKAREKAAKEAERLREEEAKKERAIDHKLNQSKLSNIQKVTDEEKDAYLNRELAENESYVRRGEFILAQQEALLSDKERLNRDYLSTWEQMEAENTSLIAQGLEPIFGTTEMQTFFTTWQDGIEGIKGGYTDVQGTVSSFVEDSLNSKDWTAGLTGQAKAIANVGNAFKDVQKQTKKYDSAVKKINKSQLNDEEKKIALKEIEEAQIFAQIGAYSNLASAVGGFFEEGSRGAEAMTAVSATLGIAQGIQAMISAWGSAPFPFNMPAVAATTAAVLPMIGQLTSMGGSSGGGGGVAAPTENFEQNRTNIENTYSPMTDRLDRQIELLESIDKNGSASQLNVSLAATSFQRDYALWMEDTIESINIPLMGYAQGLQDVLAIETKSGVDAFTVGLGELSGFYVAGIQANSDVLRQGINLLDVLRAASELNYSIMEGGMPAISSAINEAQNLVQEWAIGVVDSIDDLKDASKDFKQMFDDVTGTMFYESSRLAQAYSDVNKLIGEDSFAGYLQKTITDIDALQQFFTDETFTLLMSDSFNDIEAQIQAINDLSALTGQTFEGGAKEALNYLESIQLVADNMTRIAEDTKSVFDNIQSFVDSLTDNSIKNPSVTFGMFSESFNNMIDAIASGSEDMIDISGKAIDNARSYLDVVTATATSSRDISFAKAILSNKFSSVIATPDTTLNTINDTLKFSLSESGAIATQLNDLKAQIKYLNDLNTTNTATNLKILSTQRSILGETVTA